MKNIKKVILLTILGVLAVSSILMTIESATGGVEVSNLQKQEMVLSDQKRQLEDDLVKSLSISQLEDKSATLGFVKPTSLVYVAPSEAVAKLP